MLFYGGNCVNRICVRTYKMSDENVLNFNLNKDLFKQKELANTLSPYLNPNLFKNYDESDYISLDGQGHKRGRFELAFGQIGGAIFVGSAIGGVSGFHKGYMTTNASNVVGRLRVTQILNHVMKQGGATANTFGTIGVFFSAIGVGLSFAREDDDINTVLAATLTGHLYKISAGFRKCAIAGLIGFGASSLFCLWKSRDSLQKLPFLSKH